MVAQVRGRILLLTITIYLEKTCVSPTRHGNVMNRFADSALCRIQDHDNIFVRLFICVSVR